GRRLPRLAGGGALRRHPGHRRARRHSRSPPRPAQAGRAPGRPGRDRNSAARPRDAHGRGIRARNPPARALRADDRRGCSATPLPPGDRMAKAITPRSEDYSRWYTDVVTQSQMADYSPVKGCMVIRPLGYAVWEAMQRELDARFRATGHQNAYFPLFI